MQEAWNGWKRNKGKKGVKKNVSERGSYVEKYFTFLLPLLHLPRARSLLKYMGGFQRVPCYYFDSWAEGLLGSGMRGMT